MIPAKAIKPIINKNGRDSTETAVGTVIAFRVFPQTQEGIEQAKKLIADRDTWLVPSELPEYYDEINSDLMVGKDNDAIRAITRQMKEFYGLSSAGTETAEDTRVQTPTPIQPTSVSTKKVNVKHPELYPEYRHMEPKYLKGVHGTFILEFESDIDKAIYIGVTGKDTPVKAGIREWLFNVTGLRWPSDRVELEKYRDKIKQKIREVIGDDQVGRIGAYIDVPTVYDGYFQDPDDDEEEDEEDEEEYDDLYGSSLDDLLNEVKADDSVTIEEEPSEEKQEVEAQAEVATQVLVEAENAQEESIDESVLDDLPEGLKDTLVDFINKKKGKTTPKEEKKKTSNYVSNRKIFNFLTNNLLKIQGQLDAVNDNITRQNELLQANLQVSSSIYENIDIQNTILVSKLDQILVALGGQSEAAKKFAEDEEKRLAEESLEASRDAASTETAMSTLGKGGTGGNSLMRRLTKFFGKRLAKKLWRNLVPRRLRARVRLGGRGLKKVTSLPKQLAQHLGSRIAANVLKKPVQTAVTNVSTRAAMKGFEHIALPGVTRAMKTADAPAAKAITNSGNFLVRALKSPIIQKALIKTIGKEGAEKLTVKLAAKLIPGAATVYGVGEGIARIAMGDIKGGFLSFGSAIPIAGYGFAAVDILRDINIDAYTKHIEPNIPTISNENFAAFFTEALGVTPDQYELGGTTGSQTVMLHGTELLLPPNQKQNIGTQSIDPVGGTILAATTQYINKLGPVGAPIAPMFEQVAAPLTKVYDVPSTLVQTNVGGSLPSLQSTIRKVREKKKMTPEEELSSMEKDLLETQDPQSFADKLLKMIDPEGKFQQLLQQINNRTPVGETGEGMATFGESGIDKGTGWNGAGWVHGHFQNNNKQALVNDTFDVVKRLINSDVKTVITATNKDITKDMSDAEIKKHIEAGVDGHKKYGSGVYAIDVSVPSGTKVPFELENVYDSKGRGGVVGTMRGRTTQIMHLAPGSKAGAAPSSSTSSGAPSAMPTGEQDVIIPLDHVKPGNQNKISDKPGGNTFKNASATGADGRERQHQDRAAAKVKAKLEAKGLRVRIITPEDFGNYEDYDKYISSQASKGVRVVPLHFDAAVGQGGTGFLTRTRAGDSGDSAMARPIQQALSTFQRSNPSLGNLGPTDTASNATINRAAASPSALVEMGSMVAWERQHGANFTSTSTFDKLATGIAEGIYQGGGFNKSMRPPTQRQPAQSKYYLKQGGDKKTDTQIVMIPASSAAGRAIEKNSTVEGQRFSYDPNYNAFKTNEISSVERAKLLRRLGLN